MHTFWTSSATLSGVAKAWSLSGLTITNSTFGFWLPEDIATFTAVTYRKSHENLVDLVKLLKWIIQEKLDRECKKTQKREGSFFLMIVWIKHSFVSLYEVAFVQLEAQRYPSHPPKATQRKWRQDFILGTSILCHRSSHPRNLNIVPQEFTSKNSFSQRLGLGSLQIKIASTFK